MSSIKRLGWALFLSTALTTPVLAQQSQSPSSTWNDSVTFRGALDRSVDIQRAEAQERARRGGFGATQVVTNYQGDVAFNETNQYNGPVTNNSATTATNLNSFSSSLNQNGSGNSAGVTFTTGNTARNTSQIATATNAQSNNGGASNGTVSKND